MKKVLQNPTWLVGILILASGLLLWVFSRELQAVVSDTTVITVLDVGQGSALYVREPSGQEFLFDTGRGLAVQPALSQARGLLRSVFDRHLDAVFLSHLDNDHSGGLTEVLNRYEVTTLYIGSQPPDVNPADVNFLTTGHNIEITTLLPGAALETPSGFLIETLWPTSSAAGDTNELSLITKLTYGETSVMITGDAGIDAEQILTSLYGDRLQSEVLIVGHHGSDTSTDPSFVAAVAPEYAIISAGKDNSYGHPHPSVIDTLTTQVSTVFGTYDHGSVTFTLSPTNVDTVTTTN